MGLPWWLRGKEFACQCRRHRFDPWFGKIPWRRKQQSALVFLPGKSLGWRSLVGYSPQSCKEQGTTQGLDSNSIKHKQYLTHKKKQITKNLHSRPARRVFPCPTFLLFHCEHNPVFLPLNFCWRSMRTQNAPQSPPPNPRFLAAVWAHGCLPPSPGLSQT